MKTEPGAGRAGLSGVTASYIGPARLLVVTASYVGPGLDPLGERGEEGRVPLVLLSGLTLSSSCPTLYIGPALVLAVGSRMDSLGERGEEGRVPLVLLSGLTLSSSCPTLYLWRRHYSTSTVHTLYMYTYNYNCILKYTYSLLSAPLSFLPAVCGYTSGNRTTNSEQMHHPIHTRLSVQ